VNGQAEPGQPRVCWRAKLLVNTPYTGYHRVSTMTEDGTQVYDERNLVVLIYFEIPEHHQYKHDFAPAPRYRKVTATPADSEARAVTWERPILHSRIQGESGCARPQ
jgi:hypothetical protein